jgi:hypothetical protein
MISDVISSQIFLYTLKSHVATTAKSLVSTQLKTRLQQMKRLTNKKKILFCFTIFVLFLETDWVYEGSKADAIKLFLW